MRSSHGQIRAQIVKVNLWKEKEPKFESIVWRRFCPTSDFRFIMLLIPLFITWINYIFLLLVGMVGYGWICARPSNVLYETTHTHKKQHYWIIKLIIKIIELNSCLQLTSAAPCFPMLVKSMNEDSGQPTARTEFYVNSSGHFWFTFV